MSPSRRRRCQVCVLVSRLCIGYAVRAAVPGTGLCLPCWADVILEMTLHPV